ncbi:MAG: hypothetical protein LKJ88_03305 [Bacilli bacterium]|jgi:hypothetical protein|nr:hypothetical protein [Bacilli bacterium]
MSKKETSHAFENSIEKSKKGLPDFDCIKDLLFGVDLIDLLGKLSDSSFLLLTTCFPDYKVGGKNYCGVDNAFIFLFAFLMTHKIVPGNRRLNYEDLLSLVYSINKTIVNFKCANENTVDDNLEEIRYCQNEITEVLMPFKGKILDFVLDSENDFLKKHLDFDAGYIKQWLYKVYDNFIGFHVPSKITFREFIDNYSRYRQTDCFIVPKDDKIWPIAEFMSAEFGSLNENAFFLGSLMAPIDKFRKIFINSDGNIYCFSLDLVSSRFIRCLEGYINHHFLTEVHEEWSSNEKKSFETFVANQFIKYFPGCEYLKNNHFSEGKGFGFENDGLCLYKGILFIVEVKGGKVTPDSVFESPEKVGESYKLLIEKGIKQCQRVLATLSLKHKLDIVGNDNKVIRSIDEKEVAEAIPICVTFEEMGAYLPGFNMRNQGSGLGVNVVVINVFDLIMVMDFLNSPLFTVKYFQERMIGCKDKRFIIDDEMTILGLFCYKTMNLSGLLEQNMKDRSNEADTGIYFCDSDWGRDIEIYYSQCALGISPNSKPVFCFSKTAEWLSVALNSNTDRQLFEIMLHILDSSPEDQESFYRKIQDLRKEKKAPLALRITEKNGLDFSLIFADRPVTSFDHKLVLSYIYFYYKEQKNLSLIYIAYIRRNECSILAVHRDDERLKDDEIQNLAKRHQLITRNYPH